MTNNLEQNKLYSLSIQVRLDGFSFFIRHDESEEIISIEDIPFKEKVTLQDLVPQMDKAFHEHESLQASFSSVNVMYSNALFALVPSALFDESKAVDYLKYNTKILNTDFVAHDILEEHDLINVYIPYTNVNNYLFEHFGSFNYYHSLTKFTEIVLNTQNKDSRPEALVLLSQNHYYLGITNENGLVLANRFTIETPEDFIYYLLFSLEQLDISTDSIHLKLSGDIKKGDSFYQIAYTYVRHIEMIEHPHPQIDSKHYLLASLL